MDIDVLTSRRRIGPASHGYVYSLVRPGLWKCERGSDWSRAGEVLFLFEKDVFSVAADAEETETSLAMISSRGQAIFRTEENALGRASRGSTEWRSTGLCFETTRLRINNAVSNSVA